MLSGDGTFLLAVLVAMLTEVVEGTIMCSSCRSDTHPQCEMNPPPPQPCPEMGSAGVESCSTVRIFTKDTGELTQFLRSCSDSVGEGCFDTQPGYKTCAHICYTDGCNASVTLHTHTHLVFIMVTSLLVSVLTLKLRNGAG